MHQSHLGFIAYNINATTSFLPSLQIINCLCASCVPVLNFPCIHSCMHVLVYMPLFFNLIFLCMNNWYICFSFSVSSFSFPLFDWMCSWSIQWFYSYQKFYFHEMRTNRKKNIDILNVWELLIQVLLRHFVSWYGKQKPCRKLELANTLIFECIDIGHAVISQILYHNTVKKNSAENENQHKHNISWYWKENHVEKSWYNNRNIDIWMDRYLKCCYEPNFVSWYGKRKS